MYRAQICAWGSARMRNTDLPIHGSLCRCCHSAGVIFYEMLYGRRPFHTDVSQEAIASSNLLLSPAPLIFDAKPAVSQGAKDFIQKCLTYSHQSRPDAKEAAKHEYLNAPRLSRRGPSGPAPAGVCVFCTAI